MNEKCNNCPNLIKNFLGDDRLAFNACCGKVIIDYTNYTRPRVIKYKTGHMLDIECPDWCPKKKGIDKQILKPIDSANYKDVTNEPPTPPPLQLPSTPSTQTTTVPLTYYQKREKMKELPKHLTWDEIKENEIFVIPKLLYQPRKVIRVISKSNFMIRYNEINDRGAESSYVGTMYSSDLETVFITKLHKY